MMLLRKFRTVSPMAIFEANVFEVTAALKSQSIKQTAYLVIQITFIALIVYDSQTVEQNGAIIVLR